MVAGFHSFHWRGCELRDDELRCAHEELADPTGKDAYLSAFRTLLHSGHTAAAGIALDHFQYSGALSRFGGESVVEQYAPEVLAVARGLLRQPPTPEDDSTAAGANHASALNAMMNIAEAADADLIADALACATEENVVSAGCSAAGTALAADAEESPRLVAAVGSVAFDARFDVRERAQALSALFAAQGPKATDLLVRATGSSEIELQTEGALGLTVHSRFHAHRTHVERLAAAWPRDAGYRADLVREALTGFHSHHWIDAVLPSPELRDAHAELMFPTGEDACHRAFRTMLRSTHTVAVGIALDHFEDADGLRHFLDSDEVDAYAPEVLARAREVLRRPPSPPELSPATGAAANHLSALRAIRKAGADASDTGLVADVLERATTDDVRDAALWVAYGVLKSTGTPDRRLVDVVSRFVFDPSLDSHHATALRVLGETLGPEANPILVRAVRSDNWDVQMHAAWRLSRPGRIEEHRELLEELVEGWPLRITSSRHHAEWVTEAVLGGMHSVFWKGTRLTDPELYRAHRELRAPSGADASHRALRMLLRSGQPVAVGIALDHWHDDNGIEWLEEEETCAAEEAEVLATAREVLRQRPSPAELSPATGAGANHLSALNALRVAGASAPEDAAVLVTVLECAADPRVRDEALRTATSLLEDADTADPRLVGILGALARDESLAVGTRTKALRALAEAPGDAATEELVRATGCDALAVQAEAAYALTAGHRTADHRDLLAALVARWPEEPEEDVPWTVRLVREHLAAAQE
ncbi:hypothetical protein ACFW1M_02975 [Streptomyces inhibens]|uniref:hypothetical protein n=1 Tax=Streptomyces inhibens TaxID=2293571 RepID=UPI00369AF4CD